MPSIMPNVLPKPPVKVDLPVAPRPADVGAAGARGEAFEQLLNGARAKPPAEEPKAAPAKKSAKPSRAARSEKSKSAVKADAADEPTEPSAESADAPADTAPAAEADAAAPTDEVAPETAPEEAADVDACADPKPVDPTADAERLAEQGFVPVQAAADATADQRSAQEQPAPEEDGEFLAAIDGIDEGDPADASATAVGAGVPTGAAAPATTDVTHEPATPSDTAATPSAAPVTAGAPAPRKPSVSALGATPPEAPEHEATAEEADDALAGIPVPATDTGEPIDPSMTLAPDAPAHAVAHHAAPSHELDPAVLAIDAQPTAARGADSKSTAPVAPPPVPTEADFAASNHDKIVTSVRTQLAGATGGSMQIRLDPPELGALQVMVEMRNGTLSATFQTSSDDATQLLSHSLNQLKHVLEAQGVTVDKLQVQQAPKSENANGQGGEGDGKQQQQNPDDDHAARQEQQRKEMLRRMWRRAAGVADPLDLTA